MPEWLWWIVSVDVFHSQSSGWRVLLTLTCTPWPRTVAKYDPHFSPLSIMNENWRDLLLVYYENCVLSAELYKWERIYHQFILVDFCHHSIICNARFCHQSCNSNIIAIKKFIMSDFDWNLNLIETYYDWCFIYHQSIFYHIHYDWHCILSPVIYEWHCIIPQIIVTASITNPLRVPLILFFKSPF